MDSQEFKRIRERLQLSQSQLADMMGMHPQNVSRIETGEREPTKQQAAALRNIEIMLTCEESK